MSVRSVRVIGCPPLRSIPPERNLPPPDSAAAKRLRLQPIAWGKPDRELARVICWHIVDTVPATLIPFNPRKHKRMKRCLAHFLHY